MRPASGTPSPRTFLTWALTLGALYLVINPPFAVNDEDVHLARIYELSTGRLLTRSDSKGDYHEVPADYAEWGPRYARALRREGGRVKPRKLGALLVAKRPDGPLVRTKARAGSYSPFAYHLMIPVVWLARRLDVGVLWHVYLARAASLCVYAWLAQRAVVVAGQLGWLFFALGLMPMALTQAAGVSADGVVLGAALVYFARIAQGGILPGPAPKRAELLELCACLLLMTVAKPVYGVLGLSLSVLRWEGAHARYARWGFTLTACALSCAIYLMWTHARSHIAAPELDVTRSVSRQLALLLREPGRVWTLSWTTAFRFADDLLVQSIFVRYRVAQDMRWAGGLVSVLYAQLLVALAWGGVRTERVARTWRAIALFASGGGVVCAVPAALYLCCVSVGANEVHGVHGRYLIPAFPALLLGLSLYGRPLLARWLRLRAARLPSMLILGANLVCLFSLIGWHYFSPSSEWPL